VVVAPVTNEVMLRDIRSQADALAEGLATARARVGALSPAGADRIVVTGSGDSFIAATAVRPLIEQRCGRPALALRSLDASRYGSLGSGDLVVVVSVSGEVSRTIEAARRATESGAMTVAITAGLESSLAASCDASIGIPRPIDRSIPHSRDYTLTLLALACLTEGLAGGPLPELDLLPAITGAIVDRSLEAATPAREEGARTWFLGAGPDRATAMFGALKFWEAAGMEAWWDDLEEFGHGSQLMARPNDRVVLIAAGAGAHRALEMVEGLERMGMRVVLVGGTGMMASDLPHLFTSDELGELWHPFVSCVPLQALAYVEAEDRGLDVSVPLFGRAYGSTYDAVHGDWMRRSRIIVGDEAPG
jgi:glutamine---fructose-6-phosphate transaminase (isomerizing)